MAIQKLAYTFEEAAEQVGYSVRTLKQALADGKLTARYVKTEGVIRHEDLAAWIGQLPTKPTTCTSVAQDTIRRDIGQKSEVPTESTGLDGKTYSRPAQQAKAPPLSLPEPESEWLTPEDLGKSLHLSPGTIANWRTNKKGPAFVRIGGIVRYRRDGVEAWIKAQPSG